MSDFTNSMSNFLASSAPASSGYNVLFYKIGEEQVIEKRGDSLRVREQSPSVVPSGTIWQQRLLSIIPKTSPQVSQKESGKGEIAHRRPLSPQNLAAIELLRSWREEEGDEEEQKATWESLKQALDEDRLSDRKLFP